MVVGEIEQQYSHPVVIEPNTDLDDDIKVESHCKLMKAY